MRALVFFPKQQAGFTLTELLVALVVSALTTTALIKFFSVQTASQREQNARRAAQVTARGALNFMVRELEHIGRDPQRYFTATNPAIQQADESTLRYRADLRTTINWTSPLSPPNFTGDWEDVTFRYNASKQAVEVVRPGDVPPYPSLTDNGTNQKSYVPDRGLNFIYFKADGTVVPPGSGPTDWAQIRRINVSITVRGIFPDGHSEPGVTLSQDVILRNVS